MTRFVTNFMALPVSRQALVLLALAVAAFLIWQGTLITWRGILITRRGIQMFKQARRDRRR